MRYQSTSYHVLIIFVASSSGRYDPAAHGDYMHVRMANEFHLSQFGVLNLNTSALNLSQGGRSTGVYRLKT